MYSVTLRISHGSLSQRRTAALSGSCEDTAGVPPDLTWCHPRPTCYLHTADAAADLLSHWLILYTDVWTAYTLWDAATRFEIILQRNKTYFGCATCNLNPHTAGAVDLGPRRSASTDRTLQVHCTVAVGRFMWLISRRGIVLIWSPSQWGVESGQSRPQYIGMTITRRTLKCRIPISWARHATTLT